MATSRQNRVMIAVVSYLVSRADLEESELMTRIGMSRDQLNRLLARLAVSSISDAERDHDWVISNCFNECLHGLGITDRESIDCLGMTREELQQEFSQLQNRKNQERS
ncbi:unnamed protein product [Tuwongella immobilis]|uniref:Uncharacterized protein n=1 Tax=Tuwongella immobilis TaxID=692036 RepID=A0A6C2YTA3_9BACT|nr:unnamed protein product [Tuwongella immobilis]VTS06495.1 unnamed protein product [Tuwongella immobilis]